MSQNLITLFLVATLGQFQGGGSPYGGGAVHTAPNSTHSFGTGDPTNPYDFEPNWAHGYYQDIPSYHGHHFFRPYNYKHVMPQSQTAAAWGIPPQMPISHSNFNAVNGVPTASRPAAPIRSSMDEMKAQLAKIDRQKSPSTARRQGPPQMSMRRSRPQVVQTEHQQPRLSQTEELRQQINKLSSDLERLERGQ